MKRWLGMIDLDVEMIEKKTFEAVKRLSVSSVRNTVVDSKKLFCALGLPYAGGGL